MTAPLEGLKILDFTTLLPGPFGVMILADLGAEVLRVEAPNRPDLLKLMPPMDGDLSGPHRFINRNKQSIALDLKKPSACGVVKRLVSEYDIVVEQFRPGVMDKLGVGYEALAAANPQIIFCSITGYGQDGPYRDRAGHDNNYLSIAGVMSYCGREATGPVPSGLQIADQVCGGYNAVVAILAAVLHRQRTGEGQSIDIAMTDGAIALGGIAGTKCLITGESARREGEYLNGGIYYDYYRTSDGGYMSVGSLEPQFFAALLETLGREDLNGADQPTIKSELAAEFARKTRAEWMEIFGRCDACVEPVLDVKESLEHPHIRARGMVVDVPRPDGTLQQQVASPFKFSRCAPVYRHGGVQAGAHTLEVVERLGYSQEEVEQLQEEGVFG
jgi:crotonobetainyl-CoA:carnitine CoA-transferase CaiB-like acyl-CoA transferase